MKSALPPRVHEKNGSYYLVTKNKWRRLSRVKQGLPEMYRALAELTDKGFENTAVPSLIANWMKEVSVRHAKSTQANDSYMCRTISEAFAEFDVKDVKPTDVTIFLKSFKDMPRSYNGYRSHLRELMRFAEEIGWRDPGTNPVDPVRTMAKKARNRYITDSELRRIKIGAVYSNPHPTLGYRTKNRSGLMLCALIDMAYLTGQRIGDLLTMEWSEIGSHGILFEPSKVAGSTGAKVLIEWSPKLRNVVERLKVLKRRDITRWMFTTQVGQQFTYSGASTAWKRAVKRAGVIGVHFHDIRAKALTDVDESRGIGQAQRMGGHSTQTQTADYVRHKTARRTGATK
jgi:integrase